MATFWVEYTHLYGSNIGHSLSNYFLIIGYTFCTVLSVKIIIVYKNIHGPCP